MPEEIDKVGNVSQQRYEQIVAELRQVVEQQSQGQFTIGDRALEIEPMRGSDEGREVLPGQDLFTVRQALTRLAEDIGLRRSTVENARWTASRWPKEHRQAGVSFTVHRVLGSIPDEEERFAAIKQPPEDGAGGRSTTPTGGSGARSSTPSLPRRRSPRSTPWPATRTSLLW